MVPSGVRGLNGAQSQGKGVSGMMMKTGLYRIDERKGGAL